MEFLQSKDASVASTYLFHNKAKKKKRFCTIPWNGTNLLCLKVQGSPQAFVLAEITGQLCFGSQVLHRHTKSLEHNCAVDSVLRRKQELRMESWECSECRNRGMGRDGVSSVYRLIVSRKTGMTSQYTNSKRGI